MSFVTDNAVPLIGAGSSIIGGLINGANAKKINRRQEMFSREMYDKQRAHALEDWQRQTEYDSPQKQMERFKAAGLNPNLIYGQMSNSPAVRSSDVQSVKFLPNQVDLSGIGSSLMQIYDIQMKQAQTDNLNEQMKIMQQEQALKAAQTALTSLQGSHSKFDLEMKQSLKETSVEAAKMQLKKVMADIDKVQADTNYTLDQNERAAALQKPTIDKAVQEVLNMRLQNAKTTQETQMIKAAIKLNEQEQRIKTKQADLWENNINPNDPAYLRIIGDKLFKLFNKIEKIQGLPSWLDWLK